MITEIIGAIILRHSNKHAVDGVDAIAAQHVSVPNAPNETVVGRAEPESLVARGDVAGELTDDEVAKLKGAILKSPLKGVSDEAWTKFARVMKRKDLDHVSSANAVGMFEMRPRRLADIGLMRNISTIRQPNKNAVWVGDFVRPMTAAKFLKNPLAQYNAFVSSMKEYWKQLKAGSIKKPSGMSDSGALAILHRAGPNGLAKWEKGKRLEDTESLFEQAEGIF